RQAQAEITDELAVRHFGYAAAGGFREPLLYVALGAAQGTESRDVSYFMMGLNAVPPPAAPTDAQLQTFMKAHAAQLMRPEMRVITLASFSAKAIAPSIKIDPAQVAKEFAFRKDSISTPEKRTIVAIPVKSPAEAAEAARRLSAGESAAAIAKSLGAEPVTYDDKPQSAIPDTKLAQAAFAAKPGAVAGPVAGDLGVFALKVEKVTPGAPATLATATPQIEAELRQKQAADLAYQQSAKFDAARQTGAGVADAASKAGTTSITVGPVTAQGVGLDGKPNPLLTQKMLKAAFAMPAGQDGDLEDAGSGEYFAVKVEKVVPPALPSLADKRPELAKAYMNEQLITALKAKAQALVAQSKKAGSLDAAAASVGAHVVHAQGLSRLKIQQYQALGQSFLEGVFTLKSGEVFPAGGQTGIFIGKIDAIHAGDPAQTAQLTVAIRSRASQAYAEDLLNAIQAAAKSKLKVVVNRALELQTLGVDPSAVGGGAKPAPAK
ncbi:MAG TPA: peptidyl-prolyl cis-trans isomerase, partial [Caulobacteraceae bacterium]